MDTTDTICALATPQGTGAIAVIRISGENAITICDKFFRHNNPSKKLSEQASHSLNYGVIVNNKSIIDDVVVSLFKAPKSYTGENSVEISCHGSVYIQQKIIELLIKNGIRMAKPGEFTLRGFLNNKFDLSQAEAVNDLILSNSRISHDIAIEQMRGGYSSKIMNLRHKLVKFASLLELELDFSEEDVKFADRSQLLDLLKDATKEIEILIKSFSYGNVIKKGIPITIIGKTNVGKSTLLNALLNEEKAIVSEIPGTTRDVIEDNINIGGMTFRFIDTAGLRKAQDKIEDIGIEKTYEKIKLAAVILYVFDINKTSISEIKDIIEELKIKIKDKSKKIILIGNKTDELLEVPKGFKDFVELETIFISAKRKENIHLIAESLLKSFQKKNIGDVVVSNARHYEALSKALSAIKNILKGLKKDISVDLLDIDVREALHHLGEITGEITNDELLDNIFSNFCIGK